MGNRPQGLLIAQSWQQTPEHHLELAALGSHRRLRRLGQHSPHKLVAFGRTTAVVLLGAFVLPGAGSHPRGQLCRRRCRFHSGWLASTSATTTINTFLCTSIPATL